MIHHMRTLLIATLFLFLFSFPPLTQTARAACTATSCAPGQTCQGGTICISTAAYNCYHNCTAGRCTADAAGNVTCSTGGTYPAYSGGTQTASGGCSSAGPACTISSSNDGICTQSSEGGFYCRPRPTTTTQPVAAQPNTTNTGQNVTLINPLQGGGNLESFLNSILAVVIRIGTIIVILMMVYVGFLFVKARGEPGEITKARQALLWTVVGALILLGAQVIAYGIQATVQALSVGQ